MALAASSLVAGILVSSAPASAGELADTETAVEAVDVVESVQPQAPTEDLVPVDGGFGIEGPINIVAPISSDSPISVSGASADVGVGLPGDSVDAVIVDDSVVYPDVAEDTSIVVLAPAEGVVQVLAVMESAAAPSEQRYDLDLPVGAELIANPDGSVSVWEAGEETGLFEVPWAKDANGNELTTNYTIDGDTLVQTTDVAGAVFPVVADPQYYADCGWVTCTRWVSVSATRSVFDNRFNSTSTTWALIHGTRCAILWKAPFVGAACAVWGLHLINDMTHNLETAAQNRGCIVIKYSRQFGFGLPTGYSNTTPARTSKCRW